MARWGERDGVREDDGAFKGGLTVRQWTDEEREHYLNLPPPPEVEAGRRRKARNAAARERRDAEMGAAPETKARAMQMLAEGRPVKEIAQACGVSMVTVYEWRKHTEIGSRETVAEAMSVEAVGGRIEALIGDGKSPKEIRRQLVVSRVTMDAATKRLGVAWVNDAWENVWPTAPNSPTKEPAAGAEFDADGSKNPETPKAPETLGDLLKTRDENGAPSTLDQLEADALAEAVMDRIAANMHVDRIAANECCTVGEVVAIARTRGMFFNALECWVSFAEAEKARDAATQVVEAPARTETPQSAGQEVATEHAIRLYIDQDMDPAAIAEITDVTVEDVYVVARAQSLGWLAADHRWVGTVAQSEPAQDAEVIPTVGKSGGWDDGYEAGHIIGHAQGWDVGYTQGRTDEREQYAAFTAPKDPGSPEVHVNLGMTRKDALSAYESAVKIATLMQGNEVLDSAEMDIRTPLENLVLLARTVTEAVLLG